MVGEKDGDRERERETDCWRRSDTYCKKRNETEATGCQIEGEVHGAPLWYSGVWAEAQRWSIIESCRQGEDSCSCWVHVGGKQTKGGKSVSVLSDAGGQRVFWSWYVLVLPLSSRLQRKKKSRTQRGRRQWTRAEQNETGESQDMLNCPTNRQWVKALIPRDHEFTQQI